MRKESFIVKSSLDKILNNWRSAKVREHVKKDFVVCDLGCGMKADFLKNMEEKIEKGFGFDLEVDKNLSTDKITLQVLDLNFSIPLLNNSIDLVISMAVLEHIDDYKNHINEIYRILKKNGRAVLTTPAPSADPILKFLCFLGLIDKREIDDHKRYFNKKWLTRLFMDAGFSCVKVSYFQFGFNQLVVARK